MHRNISFSNLLMTCPTSTEYAVGLLINFKYAQHLVSNKVASHRMVIPTGNFSLNFLNDLNTLVLAKSSSVLISSPNVTTSVESLGTSGSIPLSAPAPLLLGALRQHLYLTGGMPTWVGLYGS